MKQRNVLTVLDDIAVESRLYFHFFRKELIMYRKFTIGIWCVALLAVGILFCGIGVAEAGVIGVSPVLVPAMHPLAHFALWVITAITLFL